MKSIINGTIYYNKTFLEGHVLVYDTHVVDVLSMEEYNLKLQQQKYSILDTIDANGQLVVPGFIDVHIHGYKGVDTMDESIESIRQLRATIVENGVTSFLATTMTMENNRIQTALTNARQVKEECEEEEIAKGANLLGVHLEGPFINKNYKGAQPEIYIIPPDRELINNNKDLIKVITIAPEVDGSLDVIKEFGNEICFSMGHTGATYEQAIEAIQAGACSATHLFSAMTGLHHRNPGVVGAALTTNIYSELIADEFHVHPDLFSLVAQCKGIDRILLITDCIRAGGLEDGTYDLGGHEVSVLNGRCRLASGTIAGSSLKLYEGLRNFSKHVNKPLEELIQLVTLNQARYLGLEKSIGTLDLGKQADIVIMDLSFNISKTIVKGNVCYESKL